MRQWAVNEIIQESVNETILETAYETGDVNNTVVVLLRDLYECYECYE